MTAPHPQRCETCEYNWNSKNWINCPFQKDEEIYYGLKEEVCIPSGTDLFTSIVGCASHSTASNADVLDKLKQWCNQRWFEVESDDGEIFPVICVGDIIAEIEQLHKREQV